MFHVCVLATNTNHMCIHILTFTVDFNTISMNKLNLNKKKRNERHIFNIKGCYISQRRLLA